MIVASTVDPRYAAKFGHNMQWLKKRTVFVFAIECIKLFCNCPFLVEIDKLENSCIKFAQKSMVHLFFTFHANLISISA